MSVIVRRWISASGLAAAVLALGLLVAPAKSPAEEVIVTNPQNSADDVRFTYPMQLLQLAMARTEAEYGAFRIERYPVSMSRNRALRMVMEGKINVFEAPTRREWEDGTIPIRVPLRKGLLGYKLLLIRDADRAKFAAVSSIDDLKKYRLGSGLQWSTSLALKKLGFEINGTTQYEPLFGMLMKNRFDYFPRGVNEIFAEFERRKGTFPDMVIEDTLALYLPLPTYFFVTKKRPDLAERLNKGLLALVADGTLDDTFEQFHGDNLKRANLSGRRIFRLENRDLSDATPLDRADFWIRPGS